MKVLEKGKDKLQEICNALKQETLDPAKEEALRIVEKAREEAQNIIDEAHQNALVLHAEAKAALQKEREIFNSALKESAKLSIASLKQDIEEELFTKNFHEQLAEKSSDPEVIAKLLNALIDSLEKEGIDANLSAIIPNKVEAEKVSNFLKEKARQKLKAGISAGHFNGGVKLKLQEEKMTLDLSDEALFTLFERHLRKDFRKWLY